VVVGVPLSIIFMGIFLHRDICIGCWGQDLKPGPANIFNVGDMKKGNLTDIPSNVLAWLTLWHQGSVSTGVPWGGGGGG
jgi:hypothetical protein